MMVMTQRDCVSRQGWKLPQGSVIQDVKELKTVFRGIWSSMYGSYMVSVRKEHCKIYKDNKD